MALFVVLVRIALQFVFGDRSIDSLTANAVNGFKLAVWVLGFGLLNIVVDFRKLLAKAPLSLKKFSSVLSLSLSLIPAVAMIAERVRIASRLRLHARGFRLVRSIAVPVLSSAIDQAMSLADSMETRSNFKSSPTAIRQNGLSFKYPNGELILDGVNFEAKPGTLTLLHGMTGSGKSTLLKVLQAKTAGAALVGQFPRETFVAETVFDELAFAPRAQNKSKEEVSAIVEPLLARFNLSPDANLLELSAGWQQRVAIAAALSAGSKVLLLDEPFSALDASSTQLLLETLSRLKDSGITVVAAEHRTSELSAIADQSLLLSEGKLSSQKPKPQQLASAKPRSGKVTVLLGANGSGKTTHLNALAKTQGVLVPQPAIDLVFLETVKAELHQADIDAKAEFGTTKKLFKSFISTFNELQNPRDLSEGQKLALAISIQLAKRTELLILDEPTLGFDLVSRQQLVNTLGRIAESGVDILIATHDQEFANAIATETIDVAQAVIRAQH